MRRLTLDGKTFGRLTVIKSLGSKGYSSFLCRCECGKEIVVKGTYLVTGKTKSCGCLQRDKASKNMKKHGLSDTRIYRIWKAMNTRCKNKNILEHKNYYDRGINICEEWEVFDNFYKWAMENGYKENLSIDRINNDIGYFPKNCRWANAKQQNRNSRNCVFIEYNGKKFCLSEWEEFLGLRKHYLAIARYNGKNALDIIKRYYNEIK